ncbi:P1 family peptidase [Catenuloplanes japonicus]|uniref:P1 family peptidase n=1 Tax=Catenuloplanes japonicus TaxID=33876 RepID=UPI00068CB9D5|nr:P1 family peptidase [Catenuloplanes japonicus]
MGSDRDDADQFPPRPAAGVPAAAGGTSPADDRPSPDAGRASRDSGPAVASGSGLGATITTGHGPDAAVAASADGGSAWITTVRLPAGVRVGHWTGDGTGVTVVLPPAGTVGSGEVRGGAPATREFELLKPERMVDRVDAVVLSGGSAFGLAAADGVMRELRSRGEGFPTAHGPVPIVVGMSIFDASVATTPPDAAAGRSALLDALSSIGGTVPTGRVGAGTGAASGRWHGRLDPGGFGAASALDPSGAVVTAFAVVNALGSIIPAPGAAAPEAPAPAHLPATLAEPHATPATSAAPSAAHATPPATPTGPAAPPGTPTGPAAPPGTPTGPAAPVAAPSEVPPASVASPDGATAVGPAGPAADQLGTASPGDAPAPVRPAFGPGTGSGRENTTLVVVVTDAALDKTAGLLLAQSGHDGMARALHPSHTRFDGDAVVSLATGSRPLGGENDLDTIRATAIEVVAAAIRNAVPT